MNLPILHVRRSQGDDAFVSYKLTLDEQRVVKVFDQAIAELPDDADVSACHQMVAAIGEQFDLTPEQSVAFWTRTTFSIFEA